jgi:16S rRNA uridine-516 pseudouridylate synthase and related pseudouridylate synthases
MSERGYGKQGFGKRSDTASKRSGPSSKRSGPSSKRSGPSSKRSGPSSKRSGPSSKRSGPSSKRSGPSSKRSGPSSKRSDTSSKRSDTSSESRNVDYRPQSDKLYLGFFKPFGVVTQFSEAEGENGTLADFEFPPDVYPVGRLDADSEGLLILTDDTRMNLKLLDPVYAHEREYWAQVENVPDEAALSKLRKGVVIQGRKTHPCRAELFS